MKIHDVSEGLLASLVSPRSRIIIVFSENDYAWRTITSIEVRWTPGFLGGS